MGGTTPASDAVFSAGQLLDLKERGVGRGVDTPMLAAVVSAALRAEGASADTSDPEALVAPLADESLAGPGFTLRPVARQCGQLLDRVTSATAAGSDPKVWEIFALFNLALGRRQAARDCRCRHARVLQALAGWEKRATDLEAIADAIHDLVYVHSVPVAASAEPPAGALPLGAAAAVAATPTPALPSEKQQLYAVVMMARSAAKRSETFGSAGSSGDSARERLRSSLAAAEALLAEAGA